MNKKALGAAKIARGILKITAGLMPIAITFAGSGIMIFAGVRSLGKTDILLDEYTQRPVYTQHIAEEVKKLNAELEKGMSLSEYSKQLKKLNRADYAVEFLKLNDEDFAKQYKLVEKDIILATVGASLAGLSVPVFISQAILDCYGKDSFLTESSEEDIDYGIELLSEDASEKEEKRKQKEEVDKQASIN